jgi:hypothetical protein
LEFSTKLLHAPFFFFLDCNSFYIKHGHELAAVSLSIVDLYGLAVYISTVELLHAEIQLM